MLRSAYAGVSLSVGASLERGKESGRCLAREPKDRGQTFVYKTSFFQSLHKRQQDTHQESFLKKNQKTSSSNLQEERYTGRWLIPLCPVSVAHTVQPPSSAGVCVASSECFSSLGRTPKLSSELLFLLLIPVFSLLRCGGRQAMCTTVSHKKTFGFFSYVKNLDLSLSA